jgi:hypothetical protein
VGGLWLMNSLCLFTGGGGGGDLVVAAGSVVPVDS